MFGLSAAFGAEFGITRHLELRRYGFFAERWPPAWCVSTERIPRGAHCSIVPLGIAAAVVQASIYDVPGGYRAVMFDRFSGVKDTVRSFRNAVGAGWLTLLLLVL